MSRDWASVTHVRRAGCAHRVWGGAFLLGLLGLSLWMARVGAVTTTSLRIEGVQVPRGGSLSAHLAQRALRWGQQRVTLETGHHVWRPSRAELGAALPVADARARIDDIGRSLDPRVTLRAFWRGRFGAGHDVPWRPRVVDAGALAAYVERIRAQVDRLPTPASRGADGSLVAGLSGEALDVRATERALARALVRDQQTLRVATLITPPPEGLRTFSDARAEASVLMMRQDTTYRASNRNRAINIELSARKLDGVVLMPGATFSFNQTVGKRTREAGFAEALELANGELVMGVGGGVCQTAGTLHAAAFFGGLIVEEYRPHSRLNQFAYLRPGLDTMVAWPDHVADVRETKDMRLRNPYPFPVLIRTALISQESGVSTLRVELHGSARPFRVDYSFEELERVPSEEVRRPDGRLARGQERLQQEALSGLVILRRRTIFTPTQRIEEVVKVAYPPTPRIIRVGAG